MRLTYSKGIIIISTLLLLALFVCVSQRNLISWPVGVSQSLSGTLGEIRGFSLHQGIDIKTMGRCGYPVFATSSGKLYRLLSKEYGYGNAIFIDHGNNIYSIYGHLDSFENKNHQINTLLKVIKMLYNNNNIDFKFSKSNLFYNKGEIIAYSGESGSGYPHLHFEIREKNKFLNPIKFIPIKDKQPPVIESLFLCIEKDNTTISENRIRVFKKSGIYQTIKNPVIIRDSERYFIKLLCYDRIGAQNRVAVYKIILLENHKKIFEIAFDTLSNNDFEFGHYIYDISKSKIEDGVSFTYFLCRRYGNNFNGIEHINNGYLNLNKIQNDITIIVEDYAGNKARLEFKVNCISLDNEYNYTITKKRKNHTSYNSKNFKITIDPESILEKNKIKIKSIDKHKIHRKISKKIYIKQKDILEIYAVYPFDIIYKKPITIQIKRSKSISKIEAKNILIYHFYEYNKPKPLKTKFIHRNDLFETTARTNGYFALIIDRTPPSIYLPPTHEFVEDKDIYRKIRLYTYDNLSLIDTDAIECIIDGELYPLRFDNDRRWIEIILPKNTISKGLHHILVKLSDRANNKTVFRDLLIF